MHSHLRLGPPEDDEPETITDEGLKYIILGTLRSVFQMPQYPVHIRAVLDNFDDNGDIKDFSVITKSGLKYTVKVEFEGQIDEPGG